MERNKEKQEDYAKQAEEDLKVRRIKNR